MKLLAAATIAFAAGVFTFAFAAGVTGSLVGGALAGLAGALAVGWAVATRALLPMDDGASSRPLKVVSAAAVLVAVVQLSRLTVFMVSPAHPGYSTIPSSAWEVRHSCLSAYFVAGEAVGRGADPFDPALYTAPEDTGSGQRKARMMGIFGVDVYEYPPPFLLVPRACRLLTTDFFRMRAVWFGLCGAFVLLATVVIARRMGPVMGTRALLLLSLYWAAPSTWSTLQKGNIQLVVVALAMLGMVLFERRRFAAGGALLAYAIVSKLYPGMLGLYLLGRRQWRAAAWTAAMGLALVAVTLADVGLAPFVAFVHHLPGLLSGEAFPAFRNPGAQAINLSVPGLVFKAGLFGVPGMGFGASKVVGWIFTVVLVWVTLRAARRQPAEGEQPLVWMAIVILATLRSPFLPATYGVSPALWILTLLAATYAPTARTVALCVLAFLVLNIHWPLDWPMDPRVRALLNGLPQLTTIALAVMALRRRVAPEPLPSTV
jgi:hypothetical protein